MDEWIDMIGILFCRWILVMTGRGKMKRKKVHDPLYATLPSNYSVFIQSPYIPAFGFFVPYFERAVVRDATPPCRSFLEKIGGRWR